MIYYLNEAAFNLPDLGFADRSVHKLFAQSPLGGEIGVVAIRVPLDAQTSLEQAVLAHQEREQRTLRGWAQLFGRAIEVDGYAAIEVGVRWKNDAGMVYHRQIHIGLEGFVLILAANAPMEERETCDAVIEEALRTFRMRRV